MDGCLAIYSAANQRVVVLNRTASDIWRLCTGEHDLATMSWLLASRYGMDAGELAGEVAGVVSRLTQLDLLSSPGTGAP